MAVRIRRVKWRENLLMCYMDRLVSLPQHFPLDQAYNPLPEFGSSEMQGASSLQLLSSGKIFFLFHCFPQIKTVDEVGNEGGVGVCVEEVISKVKQKRKLRILL